MSKTKYIVEIDEECDVIQQICVKENGTVWTDDSYVSNLEELNSDYINEHFSDLLDTAYQKGFKDGREVGIEDGMFESWEAARKIVTWPDRSLVNSDTFDLDHGENIFVKYSASEAIAKLKAYEEHKDDSIKVGDWVYDKSDTPNSWAVVTWTDGDDACIMCKDGSTDERKTHELRKSGRHFDIEGILEAMKNG